jgi:ribosomal protein S18 acetylase RimI-like enzyme
MTANQLTIRPIADGEEAAVIALWHACGLTRPWNDSAQDLAFARGRANSDVLVGLADERIVASAMVGHDGHRGTMYYVSVAPLERGRGWGRQMVAAAEAWLRARGGGRPTCSCARATRR